MSEQKLLDTLNDVANDPSLTEEQKSIVLKNLARLRESKVNILITGATGAGKSSTINALFNADKAKVGTSSNPETMDIKKFELNNMILWDSPGLGDSPEKDLQHAKGIISKLTETNEEGELLIDLVLVILEGATRDLGTSYQLITEVIIPNLGEDKKRLLIAINQADVAMKGRGWDYEKNEPMPALVNFLNEKVESTRLRIKEATGVDVTPIYYSAGYKDETGEQKPYNLSKLLAFILRHTKPEKRILFADKINKDPDLWKKDDKLENYQQEIEKTFIQSVIETVGKGIEVIESVGKLLEDAGKTVVTTVAKGISSVASSAISAVKSFFSWW